MPSSRIVGAWIVAWVPPLTAGTLLMTQSSTNCRASVLSARYRPRTRSAVIANEQPMTVATAPARTSAISNGMPARVACTAV